MKRILLEKKDLSENRIYALPERLIDDKVRVQYREAGFIENITPKDGTEDYWSNNGIVISAAGSLAKPSPEKVAEIEDMLRQMPVDAEALLNARIQKDISTYEIISGDIYVARASGLKDDEKKNFCLAFIVDSSKIPGMELKEEDEYIRAFLKLDNELFPFSSTAGSNFEFAVNNYEAKAEFFKAGEVKIHRKTLNPFYSRGTYGGSHSNPAIISILTKRLLSMEHPDDYKSEIIDI